ncbi:hypothetical protein KW800_00755 [Candidatus Parcubacteria bacterium]|nr:hypothetical protein [Candidatus Parcubacteria bacterium]
MVTRLISVSNWGNCYVLDLEPAEVGFTGVVRLYQHLGGPIHHSGPHQFDSLEDAKRVMGLWFDFVETEEELIESMQSSFPGDADVALLPRRQAYGMSRAYKPKGYDLVWAGHSTDHRPGVRRSDTCKVLVIRIPESGQVRCPKEFMGRVIGKKGVKVNELSKKHGVRIRLVKI